ncbi:hypothetical protein [Ramlibacter sp.]|uniref:hypothetical protein n=1 Tax=Ramlibacter sp. TaxID=1917967 RepID=UPI003D0EB32F
MTSDADSFVLFLVLLVAGLALHVVLNRARANPLSGRIKLLRRGLNVVLALVATAALLTLPNCGGDSGPDRVFESPHEPYRF